MNSSSCAFVDTPGRRKTRLRAQQRWRNRDDPLPSLEWRQWPDAEQGQSSGQRVVIVSLAFFRYNPWEFPDIEPPTSEPSLRRGLPPRDQNRIDPLEWGALVGSDGLQTLSWYNIRWHCYGLGYDILSDADDYALWFVVPMVIGWALVGLGYALYRRGVAQLAVSL